jgi:phosphate transport system substrate-binding protein
LTVELLLNRALLAPEFQAKPANLVPVVNVEGIKPGELHFSGPVLADIFLGNNRSESLSAFAGIRTATKIFAATLAESGRFT